MYRRWTPTGFLEHRSDIIRATCSGWSFGRGILPMLGAIRRHGTGPPTGRSGAHGLSLALSSPLAYRSGSWFARMSPDWRAACSAGVSTCHR